MDPILDALTLATVEAERQGALAATPLEPGASWVEGSLPLDALSVAIEGLGPLAQPLPAEAGEALLAGSVPARFGRREKTLFDTRVRHTGVVEADSVSLTWAPGAFQALQEAVARGLGLPAVQASLHDLLVYGPGQFFKRHQDTEKLPGMVATLVLVWPSAHIGGSLRLSRQEQAGEFASQHLRAPALRWLAFYADCMHEVLPVTEGWRVVLSFDLVVPAQAPVALPPPDPALVSALRHCLADPETPRRAPWVLLLDHQYTEHGLRWGLLKADDRRRVPALRAAAEALGLHVHLALAEVHELWTATVPRRGRRGESATPAPDELVEEDLKLDFWVGADDQPVTRPPLRVSMDDVASFVATDEAFLVDEAYEGYMGNYGETLDYWYRRAAVVLQSPLGIEADRFRSHFDAALADAVALTEVPEAGALLAQRLALAVSELRLQLRQHGRELFSAYARLALALPDASQAQALLSPLPWTALTAEDAPMLAALAGRWGTAWLTTWWFGAATPPSPLTSSPGPAWTAGRAASVPAEGGAWPRPLPPFVQALRLAGLDEQLVAAVHARALDSVRQGDAQMATGSAAMRQATLGPRLRAVAELLAALSGSPAVRRGRAASARPLVSAVLDELLVHIQARPVLYPPADLRPLVEALGPHLPSLPAAQALREATITALQQRLAEPQPADDDQRLDAADWICRCADCAPVRAWLASPGGRPLVLAMAEHRRQHVINQAAGSGLPLQAETLKQGSPYKLQLAKPADLPARRRAQRAAWAGDLAALAGPGGA